MSGSGEGAGYRRRVVDAELDSLFPGLPAILLDGPKGAGKTETASRRVDTRWQLDDTAQATIFDADPDAEVDAADVDDPPAAAPIDDDVARVILN